MGWRPVYRGRNRWLRLGFERLERRALLSTLPGTSEMAGFADIATPASDGNPLTLTVFGAQADKDGQFKKINSTLASVFSQYQGYRFGVSTSPFEPTIPDVPLSDGAVLIDAVASGSTDTLAADLLSLGMTQISSFGRVVSGWIPLQAIDDMAALDSLQFGSAALRPQTNAGRVNSQGDKSLKSDEARNLFGVDGNGVTVGVLSDSFNAASGSSYAQDRASGDLPPGIKVLADHEGGVDEGRAMMQLVYDVAPGVDLAFHTAFDGMADFANGIVELADAGADVIVDDVIYFAEPMFQDGIIAQAVDTVAARGVPYFSSAGNAGRDGYQSAFVNSGEDLRVNGEFAGFVHDFDPGPGVDVLQRMTVPAGTGFVMTFQWDEPFYSAGGAGSRSDLDIYLISNGTAVAHSATANIGGDPVEIMSYYNIGTTPAEHGTDFDLVISLADGPAPGLMKTIRYDRGPGVTVDEFDTASSTVFGHANASGAEAVGAAFFAETPEFGVAPPRPEPFSSAGGTPILFDSSGNRQAIPLQLKPEIVAPDGTNNTFFGVDSSRDPDSHPNFFGTSAAAPHAAGVAALMLEQNPSLTPAQVYQILEGTAVDMGTAGFDFDTGHGLVNARAAVAVAATDSQPPVITSTPLTAAPEDSPYAYDVEATDPDAGDTLTFSLDFAPNGMMINEITGLIQWTPTNEQVDDHVVSVRVSDQVYASSTQSFTVTVANVNDSPQFVSQPIEAAVEGYPYRYDAEATDVDAGDSLLFSLDAGPAGMTIDSRSGLIQWTPMVEQVSDQAVTVRVVDESSAPATQSFTISVAPRPETQVIGESDSVTVGQPNGSTWQGVAFTRRYANPVVVMGPVSFNGSHPSVVRVRNVTSTGFEFQIDEWDYLDGAHATETIGYLVLEAGSHVLGDGTKLIAGKTTANHTWRNVSLSDFDNTPLVLAQVTSVKGPAAVTTRLRQVANAGFQVRVQEEQANDGTHAIEQISYVAVERATGLTEGLQFEAALTPDSVTQATTDIAFLETFDSSPILLAGIQTSGGGDPSALRYSALSPTGTSLFIEEERSADSETGHTTEVVGYFALDGGTIRALAVEPNTTPLPQSGAIGESGSVTAGQANASTWQSVSFARSYADPVVVMGPPSYVGAHPSTVRVRNVTSTGFQFQIDEWDYLDGAHGAESIGYLVVGAGSHLLADGTKLVAGKTTASHAWKGVSLSGLSGTPVVLAQVAGVAESAAVTVRLRNASAAGFQIRLQEEQANDGLHAVEQINYVAIETARGATGDVRFESALTSDSIRQTTSNVGFEQTFRSTPVFLANIQSFDGTDPAALRHSSLTTTGASFFAEEERSADSEVVHASEVVGYFSLEAGLIDVPPASSSAADATPLPGGFDLGVPRTSSKASAFVARSESAQPPSPTGSRVTTPPLPAEPRHFRGSGSSGFSVTDSLFERGTWSPPLDDALIELLASAWRNA